MQLGFEKFLIDKGYDGFSANFDSFREDGRFEQIGMLAASNLMAKGYAYSNEGDVHTALLAGAGHALIGNAHFTEMYSLDFEKDSALMSHMGEGNGKIARRDRPIKLINRELEIGGLSNPPTVVFSAQPGPATLVSLASLTGREHRFIAIEGDILDTEELTNVPMPYFHFRPRGGIRVAMDSWLQSGGTHHQVLNLGHHGRRWKMLARILGVDFAEIG
jgi:L-arabinose isomerase